MGVRVKYQGKPVVLSFDLTIFTHPRHPGINEKTPDIQLNL
jgi:hypothetical protein